MMCKFFEIFFHIQVTYAPLAVLSNIEMKRKAEAAFEIYLLVVFKFSAVTALVTEEVESGSGSGSFARAEPPMQFFSFICDLNFFKNKPKKT